jgi:translation initiation factor IF-1
VAKESLLEVEGIVEDVLPNATFKVRINEHHLVTAVISGKMRQHKIRILMGDHVKVEVSAYDLSRGRVTYRSK